MENKKYVKFSYELDVPFCDFNELELLPINNDNLFSAIEFKNDFATLFCKEELLSQTTYSIEEIEKFAECKLFAIFLEIIKYSGEQRFKIHIEESYIRDKKMSYLRCDAFIRTSCCSVEMEVCGADRNIITEEENKQRLLERNKNKMEQVIFNSNDMMTIQEQDKQRLMKIFMVEDSVIRYFILYSWLSELLGNQDNVNTFIINSNTYAAVPDFLKHPPRRNDRDDKTYFTYLRNLMGHTVTDALAVSDITIIDKVKSCTSWLFQILLEKLI